MKCWKCGETRSLRDVDPKEYKKRKIENMLKSFAKAKANGTHIGRPILRDDKAIRRLRKQGLTMSEIALQLKTSIASVQRGLK